MTAGSVEGSQIRAARERLGLSQAKLAGITGVQQASLSAFELGKAPLGSGDLERVLDVLSQDAAMTSLAGRKKRYQRHEFAEPR